MGVYFICKQVSGRVRVRASLNIQCAINRDRFELCLK